MKIIKQNSTTPRCADSKTPSIEPPSPTSEDVGLLSNNPSVAGLPGTPAPVICEFCGAERYTAGVDLRGMTGKVLWYPCGAEPCTCPEGIADYQRIEAEREARKIAEEKAEADRKMRERVRKVIGESGMGERFLRRTFQSFIAETTEHKKIKLIAQNYADNFDDCLPKRGNSYPLGRNGFYISGTKGTGKTHIAAAIANSLLNRGIAVICMTERNLLDKIRLTYSQEEHASESVVRGIYEKVPLLIIDDLGKEKATEWTLATLYAIIDGRYNRDMPTIITSNYGAKSLIDRLTPAGERDKTTADAIIDRLNEMCESIIMCGDSWRSR